MSYNRKRHVYREGKLTQKQRAMLQSGAELIDSERSVEAQRKLDLKFDYIEHTTDERRLGWLINIVPRTIEDEGAHKSAVDLYFVGEDGKGFRSVMFYLPYFYIAVQNDRTAEVEGFLRRKFPSALKAVAIVQKEDLDLPNHLSGLQKTYMKLIFLSVRDLLRVRKDILPAVTRNRKRLEQARLYAGGENEEHVDDFLELIIDIREWSVPYHVRVCIDTGIRVANWFEVSVRAGQLELVRREDRTERADARVLAFDIETSKSPLKFPDSKVDQIYMISYMVDRQGYLIINREIVAADIQPFEYTPKPDMEGFFETFNTRNEKELIVKFFEHIRELKPKIFVTYNGDFFDWPFLEARALSYGLNMRQEIGFYKDERSEFYSSAHAPHMDAFCWVRRDSYLPQGSQGLKAVTTKKLGYNPLQIDPELMLPFAREKPQEMASYSVSDALATFHLYMQYVHPFIFSLCSILPMVPDEVLRKGTGTLCEMLLMVQAYEKGIICPNKQQREYGKCYNGYMIDTETYIGGHVEALQSGIFRADIAQKFMLNPSTIQMLLDSVDSILKFAIEVEGNTQLDSVAPESLSETRAAIVTSLESLRDSPSRSELPRIYHLDVAAMYPNIILTNRLQPCAIVKPEDCAACIFNKESNRCQRCMDWQWRAEVFVAKRGEHETVKRQLMEEYFDDPNDPTGPRVPFSSLPVEMQDDKLRERLTIYCRKIYKKIHETFTSKRTSTVCQRENPFYVDTVRNFRDRRYQYKGKLRDERKLLASLIASGASAEEIKLARDRSVVWDSLQLAHKCILNSFYGYVMRRGSRWYSMEMAAMVTHIGGSIIMDARKLVQGLGVPLELDTDGIWCTLPSSFPESYSVSTKEGKKPVNVSFPCSMLNYFTRRSYENDQYQTLVDPVNKTYQTTTECSIFFEVDGPYLAMILPAAKEEGKKLKKRYCVFDFDRSMSELKGFELKRRGELKLVKNFQNELFDRFLEGKTLQEAYDAVGELANHYLDILFSRGVDLSDEDLFELIAESRSMSRLLADYGVQKSTAISTAKRLAELLGDDMVKEKGLACTFVIAKYPAGASIAERAVPLEVFRTDSAISKHFLRKWCKQEDTSIRSLLDWEYYIGRLSSAIQKIISIPCALQGMRNPVPRVEHPDWLAKQIRARQGAQQLKLDLFFSRRERRRLQEENEGEMDIEDSVRDVGSDQKIKSSDILQPPVFDDPVPEMKDGASKLHRTTGGARAGRSSYSRASLPTGPCPSYEDDFSDWLEWRKAMWRVLWDSKRRGRNAGDWTMLPSLSHVKRQNGVGAFFTATSNRRFTTHFWHVLQVRPLQSEETDTSGDFLVLLSLGGVAVERVILHVPRTIVLSVSDTVVQRYAALLDPSLNPRARSVSKILPHGSIVSRLIELEIPESDFRSLQSLKSKSSELFDVLAHPDVLVFETGVPLLFRALLKVGCYCSASHRERKRKKRGRDGPRIGSESDDANFDASQITARSSGPYLRNMSLRALWVCVVQNGDAAVAMVGTTFPTAIDDEKESLRFASLTLVVFNPYRHGEQENVKPLLRSFKSSVSCPVPGDVEVDSQYVTRVSQLLAVIKQKVRDFEDRIEDGFGSLVVGVGGTEKRDRTQDAIPIVLAHVDGSGRNGGVGEAIRTSCLSGLARLVPIVGVPDPTANKSPIPALNWQRAMVRLVVGMTARLPERVCALVRQSRCGGVPLGNLTYVLPSDDGLSHKDGKNKDRNKGQHNELALNRVQTWEMLVIDLAFGRTLIASNHVLWACEGPEPDLPRRLHDPSGSLLDVQSRPERIEKGYYDLISVELDVSGLAVSTILETERSGDVDGHADFLALRDAPIAGAFGVVRALTHAWVRDAAAGSVEAQSLVSHVYRWIRSKRALFFDPSLAHHVHELMKKVFFHLLAEIRRLAGQIIYANFARVIICTRKDSVASGIGYLRFVREALENKSLFCHIQITPQRFWRSLLFLDVENYGGIQIPDEDVNQTLERMDVGEFGEEDYGDEENPVMHWNVTQYFPLLPEPSVQRQVMQIQFNRFIGEFLTEMRRLYRSEKERVALWQSTHRSGKGTGRASAGVSTPLKKDGEIKTAAEEARDLVAGEKFSNDLFDLVRSFLALFPKDAPELFPVLAGSHRRLRNPTLEFIKVVCTVLSLDERVVEAVRELKRNILALAQVSEGSVDVEWENPAFQFVLPDVICPHCEAVRDLDLVRDNLPLDSPWLCESCGGPMDKRDIEQTLEGILRHRVNEMVLQDIVCERCNQVKGDNFSQYCKFCSSPYVSKTSSREFQRTMSMFSSLARFRGFAGLGSVVDWLLEQQLKS